MNVGVFFLILAMLLTPAVDGVAKTLSGEHTPMMIAFVRYFSAGLIALAVATGTGRRIVVATGDRAGQLARTALIMAAMTALIGRNPRHAGLFWALIPVLAVSAAYLAINKPF